MTTTTETGHAKNMANYDELLHDVGGLGKKFQPSKPNLALDFMKGVSIGCRNALNLVMKARATYQNAVDAREFIFSQISRLVSRILNTAEASDVPAGTVETCRSIARKIQGRRATKKRTEEEIQADKEAGNEYMEISASQKSYDNIVENFSMLVEQLTESPGYKPNEPELQTESLNKLIADLRQKNADIVSAKSALRDARSLRDELMYKDETGMVDIAMDVKAYIRGAFGPASAEFRKVQGLKFRKN